VTTAKLRDNAVTSAKIATDAVDGSKVQNGSLTANDIAGTAPGGPLAGQVSLDPGSIPANQCTQIDYGLNGVRVGDYLVFNPTASLPGGYTVEALTGTVNNLHIQFCNTTEGAVDPPSAVYSYLVIHP
jgi:hypothetical protein